MTIPDGGRIKRFSLCNIVDNYKLLFNEAITSKGNLQPYLQQLANYDAREIKEFEDAISLSEDVAIKALQAGMMNSRTKDEIKKNIDIFLTPKTTKAHGRPIYRKEARDCGLKIVDVNINDRLWKAMYELYIRGNNFVSTRVAKCVESKEHSFIMGIPEK